MESYIVRVLRRQQTKQNTGGGVTDEGSTGGNDAIHLDGVVEAVDEGGEYQAFHSVDELWSILVNTGRGNAK